MSYQLKATKGKQRKRLVSPKRKILINCARFLKSDGWKTSPVEEIA